MIASMFFGIMVATGVLAGTTGVPNDATCTALPSARQGAAAVSWGGDKMLLVGGSTSPGGCKPPYTELPSVLVGTAGTAGSASNPTPSPHLYYEHQHQHQRQEPSTLAWQPFATMPAGRTHASAVLMEVQATSTLYVLGGYGPGPCIHSPKYSKDKCAHSTVWALDLALPNGTWIEKAPMPYNRSNFGTAVFGTKLYTAGGYGNYGISESAGFPFGRNVKGTDGWGAGAGGAECVQANVDVYDGVANEWSSLSPMTVARGGLSLGIVLTPDPVVYAVGGFHCTNGPAHTESLAAVEAYDIRTDTWHPTTPLPAVRALSVLVPVGRWLNGIPFVAVGGFNGTSGGDMNPYDLMRSILGMNIAVGEAGTMPAVKWTQVAEMPESRGFPAAGGLNGKVYAVGGFDAESMDDSNAVESLDLSAMVWANCTGANNPISAY